MGLFTIFVCQFIYSIIYIINWSLGFKFKFENFQVKRARSIFFSVWLGFWFGEDESRSNAGSQSAPVSVKRPHAYAQSKPNHSVAQVGPSLSGPRFQLKAQSTENIYWENYFGQFDPNLDSKNKNKITDHLLRHYAIFEFLYLCSESFLN